jgi:tRNA (cmo5U34)-methyltransferase
LDEERAACGRLGAIGGATMSGVAGPFAAYRGARAARYDDQSTYDKGDRERQYQILVDVLRFFGRSRFQFCDLGCGTGYFTTAFFEADAQCQGVALDASPEMLDVARVRLEGNAASTEFVCRRFQDISWAGWHERFDHVFSALAIHHLEDSEKWQLFRDIFSTLRPGGSFILYDLVRHSRPQDATLIEYLACRDIQRRLISHLEIDWEPADLAIDAVIAKDRLLRAREGDKEALLEDQINALMEAGFTSCLVLFLDARIVGLCCAKA